LNIISLCLYSTVWQPCGRGHFTAGNPSGSPTYVYPAFLKEAIRVHVSGELREHQDPEGPGVSSYFLHLYTVNISRLFLLVFVANLHSLNYKCLLLSICELKYRLLLLELSDYSHYIHDSL